MIKNDNETWNSTQLSLSYVVWKKFVEIIDLNCFSVASCEPTKPKSFDCHQLCVEYDGRYFIVTQNIEQVIGQSFPNIVPIQPKVKGIQLKTNSPKRERKHRKRARCIRNIFRLMFHPFTPGTGITKYCDSRTFNELSYELDHVVEPL